MELYFSSYLFPHSENRNNHDMDFSNQKGTQQATRIYHSEILNLISMICNFYHQKICIIYHLVLEFHKAYLSKQFE